HPPSVIALPRAEAGPMVLDRCSHACIESRKRRPVPQLPGIRMTDLAEMARRCVRPVGPPRRGDGPGETHSAGFEQRAEDTVAGDDEGGTEIGRASCRGTAVTTERDDG